MWGGRTLRSPITSRVKEPRHRTSAQAEHSIITVRISGRIETEGSAHGSTAASVTPYRGRFAVVASVIFESATFGADGHSVKELGQFWNPSRLVGLWIGMGAAWLVVNLAASDALAALHELAPRWAILAASTALFLGTAVVATIARIRLACDDRPN